MGRKGAASPEGLRATGDGLAGKLVSHARWPFSLKGSVLAVTVLALLGIVAFGIVREAAKTHPVPTPALSRPAPTPQKPAFTRAEEAYIQALWPIHGEVERSTVRLSLGKIFYKINERGNENLKARVAAALATYRRA